jgi:hypothetical protein
MNFILLVGLTDMYNQEIEEKQVIVRNNFYRYVRYANKMKIGDFKINIFLY